MMRVRSRRACASASCAATTLTFAASVIAVARRFSMSSADSAPAASTPCARRYSAADSAACARACSSAAARRLTCCTSDRVVDLRQQLAAPDVIAGLDIHGDDSAGVAFVGDRHVVACRDRTGETDARGHGLLSRDDHADQRNPAAVGECGVRIAAPGHQLPGQQRDDQRRRNRACSPLPALRPLRGRVSTTNGGSAASHTLEAALACDPGDLIFLALGGTHDVFRVCAHGPYLRSAPLRRTGPEAPPGNVPCSLRLLVGNPRRSARRTLTGDSPCRAAASRGGAGNRTRTYDPRITNALLYQLSYPGARHGEPGILHFFA